jgi:putative ABC transport system ATP-binding protein
MAANDASSTAAIQLDRVCKSYQMGSEEVHAMVDVSIQFAQGSFCAVMGPSGSGKSTMLNLLGCLDRPTSGTYMLANQDVSTLNDDALSDIRLKYLGFVFQSFNLIPQLSVIENIALPLFYLGWDTDRSTEHAAEIAETVGLSSRLQHRPTELSGGQQQRVAVARALANDPKVILADEPTGNLDTATGEQIMQLLTDLNRQGKTIIMVTHEASIAAHASQRVHMRDGRIERIEGDA